jgi:hypothetical protein
MLEDLTAIQVMAAYLRGRVTQLRREETGALSLEWVAVIIAGRGEQDQHPLSLAHVAATSSRH